MTYLPELATIEQSCAWLQEQTSEPWSLQRLLEYRLLPHFWLDSTPEDTELFEGKPEGFLARAVFAGDTARLQAIQDVALVNLYMPCAGKFEGRLLQAKPGIPVPLSDLRFRREDVQETAAALIPVATPAPDERTATQPALTDEQKRQIIARHKDGQSVRSMAEAYNVSRRTIDRVLIAAGLKGNKRR